MNSICFGKKTIEYDSEICAFTTEDIMLTEFDGDIEVIGNIHTGENNLTS